MSAASLKANEPSMEEILASIRRIIADDSGKTDSADAEPAPEPAFEEPEDADVLDLALVAPQPLVKPIELEPLPQNVEMDEDIEFRVVDEPLVRESEPEPEPAPPPPRAAPAPVTALEEEMLLSPKVDASVASAFQSLAATLVPQSARTLEDIVKDMMRPMLKSWLDEHLPGLVERLVKAEIERVSRGPRG